MSMFRKFNVLAVVLAMSTAATSFVPATAHADSSDDSNTSIYLWVGVSLVALGALIYLSVRHPDKSEARLAPDLSRPARFAADDHGLQLLPPSLAPGAGAGTELPFPLHLGE